MPSLHRQASRRLGRVIICFVAALVAASVFTACSHGSAVSPPVRVARKLQLKTPLIPPVPVELIASYPMPEIGGGGLVGIAMGSDGNIWASDDGGNAVARFTPDGQGTSFPMPTPNAGPAELTAGPDGNLWCTEATANAIARITTAGVVTEFPLSQTVFPNNGIGPRGIVTGSDGNLWFTHTGANVVGRMSPAGVVLNTYTIPTPNSSPIRPTSGPDGNIWLTELQGNKIARINVATGAIDEFEVPTHSNDPTGNVADITTGADGNMWFTERATSLIGRITMTGVVTEFTTPTPIARPQDITSTPDGSLWFAEFFGPGLARIDPVNLTIVEYSNPNSIGERAIVAGQGNATVWLTNSFNDAVDLWQTGSSLKPHMRVKEALRPVRR